MAAFDTDRWAHSSVILVATDLSDLDRLMPFAMRQSEETGARLLLLHVLSTNEAMSVDTVGMPYYDPVGVFEYAGKTMGACRALALERHIPCDILVREGNPAQQIAAAVRQFQVGRILLGTRSRSKLSKLFLGSVAEQVLRSVNLPVITVGPEAHLAGEGRVNEKVVLHATTLRETSRPSAALACQIAKSQSARLVLLHVLPTNDKATGNTPPTTFDSSAQRELGELANETIAHSGAPPVPVQPMLVHGNPSIEILAAATELNATWIVLGATQRSALRSLTRDRTIYRVLAHARCPVLTLREAAAPALPDVAEGVVSHF